MRFPSTLPNVLVRSLSSLIILQSALTAWDRVGGKPRPSLAQDETWCGNSDLFAFFLHAAAY
jgi:hypothetical protein